MDTTMRLENALRSAILAMAALKCEYGYDAATNLFSREMPAAVCDTRNHLHDAIEALIAAIDPDFEREHGWWEKYDTYVGA